MAMDIGDAKLLIKAEDKTQDAFNKLGKSVNDMSANFKKAGLAVTAVGVAMAAALALCVKAAAGEEAGIEKLRVAMGNVGLSYDEVKGNLEAWINTQQQKTAIADDQQRESLSKLILATGDLTKAQDLMTLAMDMSRGMGIDLGAATDKLGMALAGNWGMLQRYIPVLSECTTEEEKWLKLREMFAGQAEAYGQTVAGQFELLQNNIGDIKEAIGSVLLPILKDLFDQIMPIIEGIKEWIAENPKLAEALVKVTLAFTALTMVGGPMLLFIGFLPQIKAGIIMLSGMLTKTLIPALIRAASAFIALLASMGPAGWAAIAVGIAAAAAGIIALKKLLEEEAQPTGAAMAEAWGGLMPPGRYTPEEQKYLEELAARQPALPEMQFGGIVPGRIGQPVPVLAHGGEAFAGRGGIRSGDIHIHIGHFMGDEASKRALVRAFKDIIAEDSRRTSFSGINRLGYFPGSSAP